MRNWRTILQVKSWAVSQFKFKTLSKYYATIFEGTEYIDDVNTSYANIVSKLGEPSASGSTTGSSKTQAEWFLEEQTIGARLTLYDYQEGGSLETITNWHIGGTLGKRTTKKAVEALKQFLLN